MMNSSNILFINHSVILMCSLDVVVAIVWINHIIYCPLKKLHDSFWTDRHLPVFRTFVFQNETPSNKMVNNDCDSGLNDQEM